MTQEIDEISQKLIDAVCNNDKDALLKLIKEGEDLNKTNKFEENILFIAIE